MKRMALLVCCSVSWIVMCHPGPADEPVRKGVIDLARLYVAEYKLNEPRLYAMDGDGTNVEELKFIPAEQWLVVGIQVDLRNRKVYWTDGNHRIGRICRANLDGTNRETLLSRLTCARGLSLDLQGGRMYWSDTQDEVMYRANLDGTGRETIVDLKRQLGRPTLDLTHQKIYFGTFGPFGDGEIRRADLNGQNQEVLVQKLLTPQAIALDLSQDTMYWADSNTSPRSNFIARARLDGSDIRILYRGEDGSSGFTGIEVDAKARKVYWSDNIGESEKGVWRANLDGSDPEHIFKSSSTGAIALAN